MILEATFSALGGHLKQSLTTSQNSKQLCFCSTRLPNCQKPPGKNHTHFQHIELFFQRIFSTWSDSQNIIFCFVDSKQIFVEFMLKFFRKLSLGRRSSANFKTNSSKVKINAVEQRSQIRSHRSEFDAGQRLYYSQSKEKSQM